MSAASRTADDGRVYYDLEFRVRSLASRQQLAITAAERDDAVEVEWDRRLLTTLGVAGRRLYELRLQTGSTRGGASDEGRARLRTVQESFRCVDAPGEGSR